MVRGTQRLGTALLVAGCSTTSMTTYYVGQPYLEVTEGRVVASRVVGIAGPPPEAGPVTGGMVGGVLGPLGGLVGAGLGYLIERWMSGDREGIEYVVAMDDGHVVTIVQDRGDSEPPLPEGTPVLVETDALSSRVVEQPGAGQGVAAGAAGWIDPDALPPGATLPPAEAVDPPQVRRR